MLNFRAIGIENTVFKVHLRTGGSFHNEQLITADAEVTITDDCDGDGYLSAEDCDDHDPDLMVIGDCDGDFVTAAGDCDDTNPAISPAATEDCTDGVDNDCDGLSDDTDPDCAGDDDDDDDDDDTTSDDDDTSWLLDDDDSAPPIIERRDGCDCGNEVSGQTGLSLIFALGLIAPWRRKRFRGYPS